MTGTVVTFYSYKGGVGRSSLLANAATLLARWGYRVLCIDWDIEAPGLDEYFRPWLGEAKPGLVDWIDDFRARLDPDWRNYIHSISLPAIDNRLDLMSAGERSGFAARVQQLDWRVLYDELHFGTFLETARDEWKATYDLVFVDSRTGITDIGGICTVQLPDLLVTVFTANRQSLAGTVDVLAMAKAQRNRLPLNRAGLTVLPVLSRFDARGQDDLAKTWISRIAEELAACYDSWLDEDVSPRQFLEISRIPYFSAWTFGERIAVLEERDSDPENISYYQANVAALIGRGLDDPAKLVRERDRYVADARKLDGASAFAYDFYLSYGPESEALARSVAERLRASNWRVYYDRSDGAIEDAVRGSVNFVAFATEKRRRWQDAERAEFEEAAANDSSRDVFDVASEGQSAEDIASWLYSENWERFGRTSSEQPIPDELRAMAEQYLATKISDHDERVRFKDDLTNKMAVYALAHRTSRDELADSNNDGLVAALAELTRLLPLAGDLERLLRAGPSRLDSSYRVLSAISAQLERGAISRLQRVRIEAFVIACRVLANERHDEPLAALCLTVERRLKNLA